MSPGDGEGQGSLACYQSMGLQRVGHDSVTEQQQPHMYFIHYFQSANLQNMLCMMRQEFYGLQLSR